MRGPAATSPRSARRSGSRAGPGRPRPRSRTPATRRRIHAGPGPHRRPRAPCRFASRSPRLLPSARTPRRAGASRRRDSGGSAGYRSDGRAERLDRARGMRLVHGDLHLAHRLGRGQAGRGQPVGQRLDQADRLARDDGGEAVRHGAVVDGPGRSSVGRGRLVSSQSTASTTTPGRRGARVRTRHDARRRAGRAANDLVQAPAWPTSARPPAWRRPAAIAPGRPGPRRRCRDRVHPDAPGARRPRPGRSPPPWHRRAGDRAGLAVAGRPAAGRGSSSATRRPAPGMAARRRRREISRSLASSDQLCPASLAKPSPGSIDDHRRIDSGRDNRVAPGLRSSSRTSRTTSS